MKGSEFGASILKLSGDAREKAILNAGLTRENLPAWLTGAWPSVQSGPLTYFVAPDYFSIGTSEDFLRMPMMPSTAQTLASHYSAILPTRKMVDQIYERADKKLKSITYPADMTTATMIKQNDAIGNQAPGEKNLLAGHKKDLVVGPDLDGQKVAIYGWQPKVDVFPHQGYSTVHGSFYVDYSHGLRLVSRAAVLDGKVVDLYDIFADPKLSLLISDQGSFVPIFPNKGVAFPPKASGGSFGLVIAGAALGGALGGPLGILVGSVAGAVVGRLRR